MCVSTHPHHHHRPPNTPQHPPSPLKQESVNDSNLIPAETHVTVCECLRSFCKITNVKNKCVKISEENVSFLIL
ncbi:hypothetical protein JOQ06_022482 [Pogonophryne albipinna]|uniref:Uncharacterized protein n=1 Tax=Pogonophryne albipinna TaxID=1090488 RepID=A0AAD6F5K0_9TELE|nr:hypothetical protein JOQ06_022482 [Pogonophryne albipinna]